jgi:hypothetical protein
MSISLTGTREGLFGSICTALIVDPTDQHGGILLLLTVVTSIHGPESLSSSCRQHEWLDQPAGASYSYNTSIPLRVGFSLLYPMFSPIVLCVILRRHQQRWKSIYYESPPLHEYFFCPPYSP